MINTQLMSEEEPWSRGSEAEVVQMNSYRRREVAMMVTTPTLG